MILAVKIYVVFCISYGAAVVLYALLKGRR
jgi:hypothetical protein